MTDYLLVRCLLLAALEEELPEILAGLPVLGCRVLPTSTSSLTVAAEIYLDGGQGATAGVVVDRLQAAGGERVVQDTLVSGDWLAAYRSNARPFPVGQRWWLDPHPEAPTAAPQGRTRLAIEPRMAFGTGSHESTQLVLLDLEERQLSGQTVLDVGTGSGILALAAEAVGAAAVVGIDVDPVAVCVARQNLAVQEWPAVTLLAAGPMRCLGRCRFDLVLCNMIPESFLPLLGELRRVLAGGGEIVFSGILSAHERAVAADIEAAALRVTGSRALDEWISLRAVHA